MVVQRYTLDRTTLAGNYANGGARGGGDGVDVRATPITAGGAALSRFRRRALPG